jgi:hypothetical protein
MHLCYVCRCTLSRTSNERVVQAVSIRTRFSIVVIMQMFHPLVLSRKSFLGAESKRATVLWRPGMSSGDVALQIVVDSERLRMFALFHSADQWVDVNVDKVLLEKFLALYLALVVHPFQVHLIPPSDFLAFCWHFQSSRAVSAWDLRCDL